MTREVIVPTVAVFAAIFDSERRILCVKRGYGPLTWTLPGGRMERGETPTQTLEREVREETGYLVKTDQLIGVYSVPSKDDLVLFFGAHIVAQDSWQPNGEITAGGFFAEDNLPEPLSPRARQRIEDALAGRTGVAHVFDPE